MDLNERTGGLSTIGMSTVCDMYLTAEEQSGVGSEN